MNQSALKIENKTKYARSFNEKAVQMSQHRHTKQLLPILPPANEHAIGPKRLRFFLTREEKQKQVTDIILGYIDRRARKNKKDGKRGRKKNRLRYQKRKERAFSKEKTRRAEKGCELKSRFFLKNTVLQPKSSKNKKRTERGR